MQLPRPCPVGAEADRGGVLDLRSGQRLQGELFRVDHAFEPTIRVSAHHEHFAGAAQQAHHLHRLESEQSGHTCLIEQPGRSIDQLVAFTRGAAIEPMICARRLER